MLDHLRLEGCEGVLVDCLFACEFFVFGAGFLVLRFLFFYLLPEFAVNLLHLVDLDRRLLQVALLLIFKALGRQLCRRNLVECWHTL